MPTNSVVSFSFFTIAVVVVVVVVVDAVLSTTIVMWSYKQHFLI